MVNCGDCGKWFRDRYALCAHQSRIKPCREPVSTQREMEQQKSTPTWLNSTLRELDSTTPKLDSTHPELKSTHKQCEYCLQSFSINTNLKKHHTICKYKDDPVRLLELQHKVDIDIPENKLECRFCNLIFSRTDSLNRHISVCEDRKEYHKNLQEYIKPVVHQTIINNCNNNCTFNNNIVNVNIFNGNEDKHKMDIDCIIDILKQCLKSYPEDQLRQIAFKIVCLYDKRLKELPENNTFRVPNLNSMIAYIKEEIGWEMVPIDDGIHKVLINSASDLMTHRKELEDYGRINKLTFKGTKLPITPQIMDEIGYIKKNGIYTDQIPGSTKTAIKINNLER